MADIFVLPTYHREGFPAVIQDALAHGLPIVTSPIRGVRDHLRDGVHALFAPPKNSMALADKINILLGDSDLRERMNIANKCKIGDFDSKLVGAQYIEIFGRIFD